MNQGPSSLLPSWLADLTKSKLLSQLYTLVADLVHCEQPSTIIIPSCWITISLDELKRFPGSFLHDLVMSSEDGVMEATFPITVTGPYPHLDPVILDYIR
jgi:hypothetical protein